MAIASTAFMAAPGVFTTALASKLDKIDCSQILAAVLKADKALLGHIKMGETARNIEFNWIEDELNAVTFIGTSSVSISVSVHNFAGSISLANVIRKGALIAPRNSAHASSNDMVLRVTSVNTESLLTCTAYGSTPHTTTSVTCTWCVIAQPYGDSDDASGDISVVRAKKFNFTQIFERAIEIGQTRKGMDMEAVANELQYQIKNRTLEIKRELDMTAILGMAYRVTNFDGDLDQRSTMGFCNYIRDPDMDGTREDTTVNTLSGGALTVAAINTLLYDMWDAGGFDESADSIIVVGAAQQRIISAFEKDIRRVEQGERQVGYYRDVFLSDMGVELPVVLDRWMQDDKLLVLDRSRVAIRAMAGDAWHMEKMAKTGRSEKWQLSGQYGFEIRNPDSCHGMLIALA